MTKDELYTLCKERGNVYCIEKLSELIGKKIDVKCIFRPELTNVQIYDVFYNDSLMQKKY